MPRYECLMRNVYDKSHISFTLSIKSTKDLAVSCYDYLLDICRDKIIDYKIDNGLLHTEEIRLKCISLSEIKEVYNIESLKRLFTCPGCKNNESGQFHHMGCPSGCLHDSDFCLYC